MKAKPSKYRYVHGLIQGQESELTIVLLLELTKINSEPLQQALVHHFVKGWAVSLCENAFDVKASNISRGISRLNDVWSIVQQLKGN